MPRVFFWREVSFSKKHVKPCTIKEERGVGGSKMAEKDHGVCFLSLRFISD